MGPSEPGVPRPVPAQSGGWDYRNRVPTKAPYLRTVACPKCDRPVADFFTEFDGFPQLITLVPTAREALHPVDVARFGLPPGYQEATMTLCCSCGATPAYSASRIAELAKADDEVVRTTVPLPPRPRRIRLPS